MSYDTIFGSLAPHRQTLVCRLLALTLVPLLIGLGTAPSHDVLPAPIPLVRAIVGRRCRRVIPAHRPRAAWIGPYVARSGMAYLAQASGILLLVWGSGMAWPWWLLIGLPLLRWLLGVGALRWPTWGQTPGVHRLRHGLADLQTVMVLGVALSLVRGGALGWASAVAVTRPPTPTATGRVLDDGTYEVVLGDQFVIRHRPVDEFDRRMFLLFLRDIHWVNSPAQRPFLCQVWLAQWFGTLQELISRWEDYRDAGDWQRLMSRRAGPLLPRDQQQALIQLWARHLWWSVTEVQGQAQAQGLELSCDAITQIGRDSGLLLARRVLRERFQLGPDHLRPKQAWLVQCLFGLLDHLQAQRDAGGRLPPEVVQDLADVQLLRQTLGLGTGRDLSKPLPWVFRLQHLLCGDWEADSAADICCPHCGSSQVRRKSRTPRSKRYYDAQGQVQTVAVDRYYCQNPVCPYQTFTNLPPDLVPYSPWRLEAHVLALQAYEVGHGSYRRVAAGLGLSVATAYRWVRQFGGQLLPVAALFGVVRSSGVVGLDEKWVQVPHNDKPAGRHKKWMYVYVAVDSYTYDLLHIAIFPQVGSDAVQTFLLALRGKGYHPQVIVTDLNQDYGAVIATVFPHAEHHECVFHALQAWHQQIRAVYGKDYRAQHPEALALQTQIDRIFQARTKRTAQRRYERVLAQREAYVAQTAAVAGLFASLERHWPTLVNAIGSARIPMTNNATELVIRRFDQHYQNFCGFATLETAQIYLAVFEWCYRFTPFTQDAQRRICGKCPLELAGYEVSNLPMAQICRGQVLEWPAEALADMVPRE